MLDKQKVVEKMREISDCANDQNSMLSAAEYIKLRNSATRMLFLDLFADICKTKLYDYQGT